MDNDFLKKLEASQIREVMECMYEKKCKKDEYVIKEGEQGSHLYVLEGNLISYLTIWTVGHSIVIPSL